MKLRAWLKQYRWAKRQRSREAWEFNAAISAMGSYNRWNAIRDLNNISHVWKK